MNRPNKKFFENVCKNDETAHERYEEHLNAFIDHLESQNKELISENKELRNDLNQIDHAESCMCRQCAPGFQEMKNKEK